MREPSSGLLEKAGLLGQCGPLGGIVLECRTDTEQTAGLDGGGSRTPQVSPQGRGTSQQTFI